MARPAEFDALPPIELINDPLWQSVVEANKNDSYGARVCSYAEDWGRLMQRDIANSKTVGQCHEACSQVADYDGITGFMHGAAMSMLRGAWKYGSELPPRSF